MRGVDVDLGEIASSLSLTMGSLRVALDGIFSSASFQYSQLDQASFQRVYLAFEGNSDLCLDILRHCADYGIMFPIGSATGAPHDLRGRMTEHRSEVAAASPEGIGDVGAQLRGLGTHPTHGQSTETRAPPTRHASPDSTLQSSTVSRAMHKDRSKPDIMITPPAGGQPQGLQSPVSRGSGASLPAAIQSSEEVYRASIEEREQIFGQNIPPRRPRGGLLRSMWLAFKASILVSSKRSSAYSDSPISWSPTACFIVDLRHSIACVWPLPGFRHESPFGNPLVDRVVDGKGACYGSHDNLFLETRHYAFIVAVLTSHLTLVVALDLLEHRLYYYYYVVRVQRTLTLAEEPSKQLASRAHRGDAHGLPPAKNSSTRSPSCTLATQKLGTVCLPLSQQEHD